MVRYNMHLPRHASAQIVSIAALIAISVLVVISAGEGFKFIDGKDVNTMNKRDVGAWIHLPWTYVTSVYSS
jgi:hypothetical protein